MNKIVGTPQQRKQVIELKLKGYTFPKISETVELKESTCKTIFYRSSRQVKCNGFFNVNELRCWVTGWA